MMSSVFTNNTPSHVTWAFPRGAAGCCSSLTLTLASYNVLHRSLSAHPVPDTSSVTRSLLSGKGMCPHIQPRARASEEEGRGMRRDENIYNESHQRLLSSVDQGAGAWPAPPFEYLYNGIN